MVKSEFKFEYFFEVRIFELRLTSLVASMLHCALLSLTIANASYHSQRAEQQ